MHSYSYADRPLAAHYEEISQKNKKRKAGQKSGRKAEKRRGTKAEEEPGEWAQEPQAH